MQVSMFDESGRFGGEDDPDTDYDEGAIRFGSIQRDVTDFTKMYSTSTGDMTRDLDDPYAFEKKPMHYIPGYTGHLPLNRERFGINYREASADTINMQRKKGVHNPVVPLDKPPPNFVSAPPPCNSFASGRYSTCLPPPSRSQPSAKGNSASEEAVCSCLHTPRRCKALEAEGTRPRQLAPVFV